MLVTLQPSNVCWQLLFKYSVKTSSTSLLEISYEEHIKWSITKSSS